MKVDAVHRPDDGDRAALLALWVEAWTAAMPAIDFAGRRDWFAGHLDDLLTAGATLLLARQDAGGIAGFITVHRDTGEIDQLAVRPALQGHGLAHRLLEAAKRLSPGHLRLTVNVDNPRALALYARAGFVRTGEGVNPRSGLQVWEMSWTRPGGV